MATKNHIHSGAQVPGQDMTHPTRASKVGAPTTGPNKLYRGIPLNEPRSALAGYADNGFAGPSSVGVAEAGGPDGSGLTNIDFRPEHDPVLAALAKQGLGDSHGGNPNPVADLDRKIDTSKNVADHPGMQTNRLRQSGGVSKLGRGGGGGSPSGTVPNKIGATEAEPVRKPS